MEYKQEKQEYDEAEPDKPALFANQHLFHHHITSHPPPPSVLPCMKEETFRVCDDCSRSFTSGARSLGSEIDLWRHHVSRHSALRRAFVCDECRLGFASVAHLQRHVDASHLLGDAARLLACDECGLATKERNKKDAFRHHLLVHAPTARTAMAAYCEDCRRRFTHREPLLRHVRTLHLRTAVEKLKPGCVCDLCREAFRGRQSLFRHYARKHAAFGEHSFRHHMRSE